MKKLILFLVIALSIFFSVKIVWNNKHYFKKLLEVRTTNEAYENTSSPVLALFSFQPDFPNQIVDSFAHFTVKIVNISQINFNKKLIANFPESTPLMITIEIWGKNKLTTFRSNPLEEMVTGIYDNCLRQICTQLIGNRQNVYVRFNPEMEVPITRFPWQLFGGAAYNEAFRHFSHTIKSYEPQVKMVWGPAGYPGTMEYYPGDDEVDAASVTLKSDSESTLNVYPDYPAEYDLYRRLHRLRFINKPIFVLGSKNAAHDSVSNQMVASISQKIWNEKEIVYSTENFTRPDAINEETGSGIFELGLYDPQSLLIEEKPVSAEHLFADFGNLIDETFQTSFKNAVRRGHNVIVTFEPFRIPGKVDDLQVLQNITDGKYDAELKKFYAIISSAKRRVYLRYAQEMEIPVTRYPWQSQDPVTYIKSFRYFMNFQNPFPANIKRVWGPAGDRGSIEWWPGNDVVDFVSVAIYGLPDKNITDPEKQESFSAIFYRKQWRVRLLNKPIFITEFGVKGPEDYQTNWLEAAAVVIRENPQIVGINYFNMSDTPKAWGEIKPPDWSITKKSFYALIDKLNEK